MSASRLAVLDRFRMIVMISEYMESGMYYTEAVRKVREECDLSKVIFQKTLEELPEYLASPSSFLRSVAVLRYKQLKEI